MPDWAQLPAQVWQLGAFAYASLWPGSRIFGKALIAPARPGELALTFDDGPNATWTPRLLEILAQPRCAGDVLSAGQPRRGGAGAGAADCGGRTPDRKSFVEPSQLGAELVEPCSRRAAAHQETLEQITGAPVKFFRPPFGARRPAVFRIAREMGLTPVLWNAMTSDWSEPSAERIAEQLTKKIDRQRAARTRGEHRAARRRSSRPGRESRAFSDRGGDADRALQSDAPVCDGGCVELIAPRTN